MYSVSSHFIGSNRLRRRLPMYPLRFPESPSTFPFQKIRSTEFRESYFVVAFLLGAARVSSI